MYVSPKYNDVEKKPLNRLYPVILMSTIVNTPAVQMRVYELIYESVHKYIYEEGICNIVLTERQKKIHNIGHYRFHILCRQMGLYLLLYKVFQDLIYSTQNPSNRKGFDFSFLR